MSSESSTSDSSLDQSLDKGLSWLSGAGEPSALSVTIEIPPPSATPSAQAASAQAPGLTKTPAPPPPPSSEPASPGSEAPSGAASDEAPPRPELGRYHVLETLGQGGMGVVYLAKEGNLRRSVALKCTHSDRVDVDSLKRFVLEAQITAQLEHPGIVPVYALELANDGTVAYSMKRIEGRELADEIEALRELFASEGHSQAFNRKRRSLLDRFVRVCEAVHYAHDHGVTHRDLKPANIMLGDHHEVYVVDWGLAKVGPEEAGEELDLSALSDAPIDTRTQGCDLRGTPLYMSPEQASCDHDRVGPASDIYALGLILFELLYLRYGRHATTFVEAIEKGRQNVLEAPPRNLDTSKELRAIIARATRSRSEERYATAADLAHDVRSVLRGEETSALPDRGLRKLRRWMVQHPHLVGWLILVGVLSGVSAAIYTTVQQRVERARSLARAEARERALGALNASTARHAALLSLYMSELSGEAQAIAASTEELLRLDKPMGLGPIPAAPAAFASEGGVPTATPIERYGGRRVSLEVPVGYAPPGGEKDLPFLGGLTQRLRAPFLPPGSNPVTRDAVLRGDSAIEWTYVALEGSGAIVLFPGSLGDWGKDYDPRQKPWYRAVAEGFARRGALSTWSKPYVDGMGQGLVVTCGHVVLDVEGKFAGVAALDVTLFRVAGRLKALADELPGFRRAVLLDEKGFELASSSGQVKGKLPKHPDAVRIANEVRDGHLQRGGLLVSWCRLPHHGWTVVTEVQESELLAAF